MIPLVPLLQKISKHADFRLFKVKYGFPNLNFCNSLISMIVDDIGVGFFFPIYLIMKTKRYLPKLWDDSRQIIVENNDFFSINPAAVAPAPGAQPTNQDRAESSL